MSILAHSNDTCITERLNMFMKLENFVATLLIVSAAVAYFVAVFK